MIPTVVNSSEKNTYIKSPGCPAAGVHRFWVDHDVQLVLVEMVAIHGDDDGGNVLLLVQSSTNFQCQSSLARSRRAAYSYPIGLRRR